jgi:small-conductance mechanosensitive channel
MATLGSTGLISQAMSGLILIYSRALKKGEWVAIGDTDGIVSYVGLLSTKIETYRQEECTIPNSVVVGAHVINYSRLAETKGATLFVETTIGYDTPWRQVEAMLVQAARQTPGVRHDVPPHVLQRELRDFGIRYELVAEIEDPTKREKVLNVLLGNILDQFNTYDVQIMTPSFEGQPEQKLVVPKEKWFASPAGPVQISPAAGTDTPKNAQ